jgi:hypothetical protein
MALLPVPELWIDGQGKLQCAQYPATSIASRQVIDYRYSDLTDEEVQNLGYVKIRHLMVLIQGELKEDVAAYDGFSANLVFETREQPYRGVTGNLVEMWANLRWSLWNNWNHAGGN